MNKNSQNPTEQMQADAEQAQQEPVAWMYEWNGRTHITTADQRPIERAHPHFNKSKPLYTAPQPTENLRCKSTQKRLATLWGYVKKEPDHFRDAAQIVSVSQMLEVLRTKYSDLIYESNQKMAVHFEEDIFTINDFLQRIQQEAAEKARQPLTDEQMYSLYCEAMKGYYVSALHYWRNEEAHKFARAIEEAVWKQNS